MATKSQGIVIIDRAVIEKAYLHRRLSTSYVRSDMKSVTSQPLVTQSRTVLRNDVTTGASADVLAHTDMYIV